MATLSVDKLLDLIRLSGLVEGDLAQRTWQAAKAKATPEQAESAEFVAAQLVEAGVLTRWQTDNLLKGKHKGFILGKHKLLGHLGTGGMSAVYLGEHVAMHRRVAIKVLPVSRVEDSSYLARFYLEARAAASLDHPNIVRVYDIDHQDTTHYLVMEYVEGRDLQHTVKDDGPLPYDLAANYIAQAARGLEHAHGRGLVHRDIKPANLLVDTSGVVKVLDMGLAKFSDTKMASLTVAHDENVLGTADYLAPEQALNSHTVDTRADIYSLGCTLYFVLTGHPPFPDGTLPQRLMMHQTKTAPSIFNDRPNAPPALVGLCSRMMAKSADERPAGAGDVAKELEAWLSVAANRAAAGGETGSGFQPGLGDGGGEGSRRRKRSPGLEDTVHDRTQDTMKGPPRSAPGGRAGGLRVAKPIDADDPLAFISAEKSSRGRADSSGSGKQIAKPGSGKLAAGASGVGKAQGLGAGKQSAAETPEAPAELPVVDESLDFRGAASRSGSLRRGADTRSGGSGRSSGVTRRGAQSTTKTAAVESTTRSTRAGSRRGAQPPQWLWLVVGLGMLVAVGIVVACLVWMNQPPEAAPKAPGAAKSADAGKDGASKTGASKTGAAKPAAEDATPPAVDGKP